MFCSTIIATVGRPTLARAVESVLSQNFEQDGGQNGYEVIVVNDSGQPLPPQPWQDTGRVTILQTPHRERCVARNTGAAIAQGQYLHFLDDDDWLLPGALATWWQLARQHPQAGILYGGAQLVDRQDRPIIRFRPRFNGNIFVQLMAGEWIILGSSAIRADLFFGVGGFPLNDLYGQDKYLMRRVGLQADIFGSPTLIACIERGTEGSRTNYDEAPIYSRMVRETVLDQPGTLARMRASVQAAEGDRAYWSGKVARTYLTSTLWNLRHHRVGSAVERLGYGLFSLALAGPSVLSPSFWRAILKAHAGLTYAAGFAERRQQAGEVSA